MTPSARVLAALGLTGAVGCGDGCAEQANPCLSMLEPGAGTCLELVPEPPPPEADPPDGAPTVCLNIAPEPPVAPCLEMVEPPPDEPPPPVGPCLKVAPEPLDPGLSPLPEPPEEVRPCLDFAPCLSELPPEPPPRDPPMEPEPVDGDQGAVPTQRPVDRVLARGVLPQDVAALLAGRRG